jgi:hypothetical protein
LVSYGEFCGLLVRDQSGGANRVDAPVWRREHLTEPQESTYHCGKQMV